MVKAIALLSGGLDSILATRLMLDQKISVEAINFLTVFCNCTSHGKTCLASKSAADQLGVPLKVFEVTKEYIEIVKNPKHGYGSNMNPCLDCRIFMFKKAGEYMKKSGASFIFTGEVLGQRPMSQRRDAMKLIDKESGLEGFVLRPLSAKLLEPTIPEKEGCVDREKLLEVRGRSRKIQISLSSSLGINDYPCPAGGCLLTDPGFANRIRDLMKNDPNFIVNDLHLLKLGRHFRLTPTAKFVVGRNEEENKRLVALVKENDLIFYPTNKKGPTGVGRGIFDKELISQASRIIAKYSSKERDEELAISYKLANKSEIHENEALPIEEEVLANTRI